MFISWLKKLWNSKKPLETQSPKSAQVSSQETGNLKEKPKPKSRPSEKPEKSAPKRTIKNKILRYHGNRKDHKIIGIIIHYISAINIAPKDPYNLDKIIGIFNDYKVSADYLIDRQGVIYKLVPEGRYSYHAGISKMPTGEGTPTPSGKTSVNRITAGIELVATHTSGYTKEQYESCAWLCKEIIRRYPVVDKDHIVGHEHVSPGRKVDPGPKFDWKKLYSLLGF